MIDKLKALSQVMDMQLRLQLSHLQRIEQQQRHKRGELQELASLGQTRFGDASNLQARAVAGADTAWRAWATQRQTLLNGELAMLTAQKLSHLDDVRRAFARDQAATGLLDKAAAERSAERNRRETERLLELVIMRAARK